MLLIWKWFPETGWFSAKKNEEMWVFIVARHPTTPPFHASSSPSLSVSCALHAEMISIPAELMRFCWTEKRQGEWVRTKAHTHAQAEASWETHTHTHTISTAEAIFKSASTLARRQWFTEARTLFGFFKKKKKIIFLPSQLKSVFYFQVNCRKCCKDESVGRQSQIKPSQTWGSVRFTCLYILQCRQHSAHDTHIHTNMSQAPELGPVTMVTHCCVY